MNEWRLITKDEPETEVDCWLASKGGDEVMFGVRKWKEGYDPDYFIADGWERDADYFTHYIPLVRPEPPK